MVFDKIEKMSFFTLHVSRRKRRSMRAFTRGESFLFARRWAYMQGVTNLLTKGRYFCFINITFLKVIDSTFSNCNVL